MKRKFYKFLILIVAIAVMISASACNFVNNGDINDGSGNSQTPTYATDNSVEDSSVSLKNSITLSSGVSFVSAHITKYADLEETIAATAVDRAVVSIYCTYGNYAVTGSGVIVDVYDGVNYGSDENNIFYIITCHHVVNSLPDYDANSITVYVPDADGNNYDDDGYNSDYKFSGFVGGSVSIAMTQPVSLVGGDKDSDIAVLRLYVSDDTIANTIVKAKVMSAENSLSLGQSVFAIGNPQGAHAGWVSSGTVADLKNTSSVEDIGTMTLVGIDVNSHPGNSGGGLFNMYGELVGITNSGDALEVTDVYGSTHTISQGLNFAIGHKISDDKTKDKGFLNIATQLIGSYLSAQGNYGYVSGRRVKLGITLSASSSSSTVTISSITTDGLAYAAGLRANDIITSVSVNGGAETAITSIESFDTIISSADIGDVLNFKISRTSNRGYPRTVQTYSFPVVIYQYYFCNTGNYNGIAA